IVNFANSAESIVGDTNTPVLINSNNTISGGGTLGGGAGFTMTNSGTVNANASKPLIVAVATTNPSVMEASGGGDLSIQQTVDNTGGTIKALDSSTVTLNTSNTIKNGTFATAGTGAVQVTDVGPIVDSVTNTGLFLIPNNGQITLMNTITNTGT